MSRYHFDTIIFVFLILFILAGCSVDPSYHGVSAGAWQQLTSEQKQLIVNRSFQQEMK